MEVEKTFSDQIINAVEAKIHWYDNTEMEKIVSQFRNLHACVLGLYEALLKKGLIKKDPYKLDKKIVDIVPIEETQYLENERNLVIGTRFSDYESMLDYIGNYYKFSIARLTIPEIKKLLLLVNSFLWTAFNVNNPKCNTRGLAAMIFNFRQTTDPMTASMITDSLQKASKATSVIISKLKELSEFQREVYKANIRRDIFSNDTFNAQAASTPDGELKQIKALFTTVMGKIPFYGELVDEIIAEDHAGNKEKLREALLKKIGIEDSAEKAKKEKKIETKEAIMVAVRAMGGFPGQLQSCLDKINDNHELLESEHNLFFDKVVRLFKKAFGIKPKPVVYQVVIVDHTTNTKQKKNVDYLTLTEDLERLIRRYSSVSAVGMQGYGKVSSMPEEKILEFVEQQISECNKLIILLNALDEYFKIAASQANRSKIKGLKMELTAIKNTVVKVNQIRAEYVAYIEEEAQMKKLGIAE